jgi:hypothetical protein
LTTTSLDGDEIEVESVDLEPSSDVVVNIDEWDSDR